MAAEQRFFAPWAWIDGAWAADVLLTAGADGRWSQVRTGVPAAGRSGAKDLGGPVLPGLVNAHSHAFQRAIAGLTERSGGEDDFWRWRDRMYAAALRITPPQLEEIAAGLYAELLQGGYTHVCEFHYLHNDEEGRPYAPPAEMALALLRAAERTGIGLTLLPTLYMRSGFGAGGLRDDQRRFASSPASVHAIAEAVAGQSADPLRFNSGVALHSLRAVDDAALAELVAGGQGPVHIHVAEQQQEVDDCLAHHGRRPIEHLLDAARPDARWNLVHATQATPQELQALRTTGAAIVLCPTTEANLGDGVFDLVAWLGQGGRWSIGSDSHVTRSVSEELRLLEYSQRLQLRRRNLAARAAGLESSAAALFQGALAGGSAAAGLPLGGLAAGQRADFLVIDAAAAAMRGLPSDYWLDALVFSSPQPPPREVYVGARRVDLAPAADGFVRAMGALWGS
ncbi:MAG TPA: formimidoylglutamate deiminase [Ramlibacter sp.]|nr:formimidoylglutamate deiminase [Ramlibacter sp.]